MATKKRRKSAKVSGPKKTVKIGGLTYRHKQCSTTKTAAKAAAARHRKNGGTARVLKNGKKFCVYTGPKSKVKRKK